jgi:uncharacterized membrane protein YkvA (DUF1232 family)
LGEGGKMQKGELDFYQTLRNKIKDYLKSSEGAKNKWAEYLLTAPDLFHLLCKLALDDEVPTAEKGKLAVAIAYFVSPIDILPELFVGPPGYLDDIALAAYVLNGIINNTRVEIILKHWAGEGDILKMVQKIIKSANDMLGSGVVKKILNKIK